MNPAEPVRRRLMRRRPEVVVKPPTLTQLGRRFRTDKATFHRYTPHYQRHFGSLRNKPITLLEIGIGGYEKTGRGGASLRMWKEFFPKAQIVGLDIEDKSFVEEERIRTFQGDQTDRALLHRIIDEIGPPQIVIDDGSHRPADIRATFAILFPLLDASGWYSIEDTQTSYWPEWGGSEDRRSPDTTMGLVKDLIDGLNHVEFVEEPYEPTYSDRHVVAVHCYHNLVVIRKGENDEPTRKHRALPERYGA